jgi:hypothetical protein
MGLSRLSRNFLVTWFKESEHKLLNEEYKTFDLKNDKSLTKHQLGILVTLNDKKDTKFLHQDINDYIDKLYDKEINKIIGGLKNEKVESIKHIRG